MRERMHFRSMGLAILLLTAIGSVQAADIYQSLTMPSGNANHWKATGLTYWTPDTPNLAGNNYWVGSQPDGTRPASMAYGARMMCRTINAPTAPDSFAGDRLILTTSGTLMMKNNAANAVTVPDLRVQGVNAPRIECGNGPAILELNGVITNNADPASYLNFAMTDTSNQRHIKLTAKLTGPGAIRAEGGNCTRGFADHALELWNATNDFTGKITSYRNAKIIIQSDAALGGCTTITMANNGTLEALAPLNRPNLNLILQTGCMFNMTQATYRFRSVRLPGNNQVPKGTWGTAALAAANPGVMTDTAPGGSTLEVVTGLPDRSGDITTMTFVNHNAVWGPPLTQTLTVTNAGDAPLTFSPWINPGTRQGVELDPGSNPMYSVVSVIPATNTPLAAGASTVITVRMSGTAGDYTLGGNNNSTGTLRIRSDAIKGTLTIPIRGNTVPVEMSTFSAK